MDSEFWVLRFQINNRDLQSILDSQHYVPIDQVAEFKRWDQNVKGFVQLQKDEYLQHWKQRIQDTTKLDVNFKNDTQIYILSEKAGKKYLFFETNSAQVVFVADSH